MQHVGAVARSPVVLAPAYLSSATGAGTDFVIPNSTSYFGPSASASFDPTPTFEFDSLLPSLDSFNFDLGMDSFPPRHRYAYPVEILILGFLLLLTVCHYISCFPVFCFPAFTYLLVPPHSALAVYLISYV
ncbi:hypothetical protein BT96DRAFT_643535 [Gymnopus androsaceus JB14]|uniref:Uncharacterized protein n=1 Tax=Gymnopus androsaceus JB14 TaxID=1447944 RepID=A0A6A4HQ53_9AGAR|nr:hypothetical protein BT96DRAFT_643535 [Gymnopus androsaceus JB14]